MTEPTDAELIALLGDRQFSSIGAVREALRRWGTLPAVAGEQVAWEATVLGYIKYVTQSRYEKFSAIAKSRYKPYKCSNCATPQPERRTPAPRCGLLRGSCRWRWAAWMAWRRVRIMGQRARAGVGLVLNLALQGVGAGVHHGERDG